MWMNKEPNNIFIGQYDDRIIAVFPVVPWDIGRHSRKLSCKSAPAWSRPIYIPSPSHGPTDIMSVNITATVTVINIIMLCVKLHDLTSFLFKTVSVPRTHRCIMSSLIKQATLLMMSVASAHNIWRDVPYSYGLLHMGFVTCTSFN